jgi:hypothetical protein
MYSFLKNTPDDGCKEHPKHVECLTVIKTTSCIKLVIIEQKTECGGELLSTPHIRNRIKFQAGTT